jgi:hypothetical protein
VPKHLSAVAERSGLAIPGRSESRHPERRDTRYRNGRAIPQWGKIGQCLPQAPKKGANRPAAPFRYRQMMAHPHAARLKGRV